MRSRFYEKQNPKNIRLCGAIIHNWNIFIPIRISIQGFLMQKPEREFPDGGAGRGLRRKTI